MDFNGRSYGYGNDRYADINSPQMQYPPPQFNTLLAQDNYIYETPRQSQRKEIAHGISSMGLSSRPSSTSSLHSYLNTQLEPGTIDAVIMRLLQMVGSISTSKSRTEAPPSNPGEYGLDPLTFPRPMVNHQFGSIKTPRMYPGFGQTPQLSTSNLRHFQELEFMTRARARPIAGISFPIVVRSSATFSSPVSSPISVFGNDKLEEDNLCRPWGIACDREGNILVVDRSNDRVQVYTEDGAFVRRFGSTGSGPGQFYRPAGITVDEQNRIIVVDKDNHRVQVLTTKGDFLFTFGELGADEGQFNYPWDVATNRECQIVVSDSRNNRIQLFSPKGIFLRKYGFETKADITKYFDSPRGVAFTNDGNILVSDFNNHRIVIVSCDLVSAKILDWGRGRLQASFLRPQGIVVDDDGNVIVVDTKHHRIQVLDSAGNLRWTFGSLGSGLGQMDRPATVALTRSGRIAVVDFGNGRVMII